MYWQVCFWYSPLYPIIDNLQVIMDPNLNETWDIKNVYSVKNEAFNFKNFQKQKVGYLYRYCYNGEASS